MPLFSFITHCSLSIPPENRNTEVQGEGVLFMIRCNLIQSSGSLDPYVGLTSTWLLTTLRYIQVKHSKQYLVSVASPSTVALRWPWSSTLIQCESCINWWILVGWKHLIGILKSLSLGSFLAQVIPSLISFVLTQDPILTLQQFLEKLVRKASFRLAIPYFLRDGVVIPVWSHWRFLKRRVDVAAVL